MKHNRESTANQAPVNRASPPAPAAIRRHIAEIGERTRSLRAERGMSRKDLSRHSGISERYLAQLEGGQANISVTLLWQIAESLNVEIHELLPATEGPGIRLKPLQRFLERLSLAQQQGAYSLLRKTLGGSAGPVRGVALLGMRGGGKTTLGKRLAQELQIPFVRLGRVIEELAGMKTAELFSLTGQKAYRRLEYQALRQVIEGHDPAIVETGGSLVSEQRSYNEVLNAFYTVWIKASPEEHMERVVAQGDLRPMRNSSEAMSDLRRILRERVAHYSAANYVLDTSGRTIDDCLRELVEQCRSYSSLEFHAHTNRAD